MAFRLGEIIEKKSMEFCGVYKEKLPANAGLPAKAGQFPRL